MSEGRYLEQDLACGAIVDHLREDYHLEKGHSSYRQLLYAIFIETASSILHTRSILIIGSQVQYPLNAQSKSFL